MEVENILSKEAIDAVYKEIYASREYRKMADAYQKHRLNGNVVQSMRIAKKMKDYEVEVFEGVARKFINRERITAEMVHSMSEQDRNTMNILANGLLLISDVLDTFVFDANTILKKYTGQKSTDFEKLNNLAKETKSLVKYFDNHLDNEFAQFQYGECSDNLYKLTFNKAKSFISKLKKYEEEITKKAPRHAEVA